MVGRGDNFHFYKIHAQPPTSCYSAKNISKKVRGGRCRFHFLHFLKKPIFITTPCLRCDNTKYSALQYLLKSIIFPIYDKMSCLKPTHPITYIMNCPVYVSTIYNRGSEGHFILGYCLRGVFLYGIALGGSYF